MIQNEFRDRVKGFMSEEEIANYSRDYEPAYMNAESISKDTFCAILKNADVRAFVKSLSHALIALELKLEGAQHTAEQKADTLKSATARINTLKNALSVISANVDRALCE